MSIPNGDRYLDNLVRFVDRHAAQLLDGTLTLKLNPLGLRYVHSRLESLKEIETLLSIAPVDYLRSYVADLGDHRALEQLRRILGLLTSLKIVSALGNNRRDPAPLSLLPFSRLRVLELRGCDLSSAEPKGLLELRHTLERLVCHNSTDALRHVFSSRIVDIKDSPKWKKLSFVSCACNNLALMDDSLQLLPSVETLDLSRNRFTKVDNLKKCVKLRHLDLGFNQLRSITMLTEVSSRIVKLNLRNNALSLLRGLEYMKSLVGLDLSCNIISSFPKLEVLGSLSSLETLWLEGNPICYARWYRAHVFSFLSDPVKVKLDDKNITARETWEMHVIFTNRHKKPAGYGFYFPAKDDPEDESSQSSAKKRFSRVACIEEHISDEETTEREPLLANDIDANLRKDGNTVVCDCESKVTILINKAEYMKKERSVHWLREFKEWMDQTSENSSAEPNAINVTIEYGKKLIAGSSSKGDPSLDSDMLVKDESRPHLTVGTSFIDVGLERRHLTYGPTALPQYKEDVLLHRHLSDELQLSIGSSDSGGTTSDSDTSCEWYGSSSDDEVVPNGVLSSTDVHMSLVPCNGNDTYEEICEEVVQIKRKARSRLVPLSEDQNGDMGSHFENNGKAVLSTSGECSSSFKEEDDTLSERELCECVKRFFQTKVATSDCSETCQDVAFCECVIKRGVLRKIGLLRSSMNKLYLILIEEPSPSAWETLPEVLESYKLEDVKLVIVGLGLQAFRMQMMDETTYIFLTRSIEKTRDLFSLLQISTSPSLDSGISLQSWEQVQVKLIEKELCSCLKMGVQLYSTLLFWKDNIEGGSWEARSIFVTEGHVLLFTEDFVSFGSFFCDTTASPYYSLDSYCLIRNILELVMDLHHNKCITLVVENSRDDQFLSSKGQKGKNQEANEFVHIHKWKLQWFSQDKLLKFVSLLKAVHRETEASPLPVHCT
ncbi:Outer arm dynein light chain 1 protein [Rhynchospora pubera]|uniref:Outer arm dynein light chain 1 protein n=1 Tax=Rhynchospora pubera TaxID=906938 RepID=A0AAV8HX36_9POAL|nr:Outer arm dynein light chain 1 protein [Rhynchospora pubera]